MNVVGSVKGKHAVLVDDMIDTAGTLTQAAEVVKQHGAASVMAVASHPVLSGPAVERLAKSCLDKIIVTNSIPLNAQARELPSIRVVSIGKLLGEAVKRVHHGDSISSLFV